MIDDKIHRSDMQEVNGRLERLEKDVAEIKGAIIGNETFKQQGIISRVMSLENWRNSVTIKVAKISGGAAVVAIIISKGFEYIIAHVK